VNRQRGTERNGERPGIAIVTAARRVLVLGHVGLSSRARLPSENSRPAGGGCR